MTLEQVNDLHDKLEARVRQEYAVALIQVNPEILAYQKQGKLASYLKTLKQMQQRIRNDPEKEETLELKFGVGNNLRAYSSLEEITEIKEALYRETNMLEDAPELPTISQEFDLAGYSFLHKSDPLVASRLDLLITAGSITVEEHEHWKKWEGSSRRQRGARSLHILQKIVFQMKKAYHDFGLPEPKCTINYGTCTLSIDEATQIRLNELRQHAYALQKEKEL